MKPLLIACSRWVVGLVLLFSGSGKAFEPAAFLASMHAYPAAAHVPAIALAALLPWVEVFLGFCLVAGVAPRGAALWSGLMLFAYTLALVDRAIVVPHEGAWYLQTLDCGCGFGTVQVSFKLLENAVLIALCIACTRSSQDRFVVAAIE